MKLAAGATIGSYEVVSLLGSGGMGEVYRARDTKLRRDVALKILPNDFAADARRLSRFKREAELLASLNHPNIASIYGFEDTSATTALVLELVEGSTLADRLARGPLPLGEALDIARQLTDALDAAHERGIVHRDLKPANIAINPAGTVKVLDFGLATVHERDGTDASTAPTVAKTMPGMILGTPSYMAPEQAAGGTADRGADVWAFGCVVYEMLAGRRAFGGSTVSEILTNVLGSEPDYPRLPEQTPDSIRRLLRRCLQKDPKRRLRDIRDARLEIDDAAAGPSSDAPKGDRRRARRERLAWAAALALAVMAAVGLGLRALRPASAAPEARFEITTPPGLDASLAISPDGLKIVYTGLHDGVSKLWLRPLASSTATPLAGTEGGSAPFWSPDSRSIGFFVVPTLKRVDIDGGSPRTITAPVPGPTGGAWSADGTILFGANPNGPLFRVSSEGGEAVPATSLGPGERSHEHPAFLTDGQRFLFFATGGEARGVYAGTLGAESTRRLIESDGPAVLTPAGQLLVVRQGTLWAQELDHDRLEVSGAPIAVDTAFGTAVLAGSPGGPIAFRRPAQGSVQRRLTWISRSGQVLREVEYNDGAGIGPALSNDGRHLAVYRYVDGNMDVWSFAVNREAWARVTVSASDEINPLWSPDGTQIVFGSRRAGRMDLFRQRVTGQTGDEELLLSTPEIKFPMDWSRDGRFLLYNVPDAKRGLDIWVLPLDSKTPSPVIQTEFDELFPQVSPSGGWMAYQSNRTGRHALSVSADGLRVEPDMPRELFVSPRPMSMGNVARQRYAVAPDGSFVVLSAGGNMPSLPITVILNWKPPAR